jgi:hypothetical protein
MAKGQIEVTMMDFSGPSVICLSEVYNIGGMGRDEGGGGELIGRDPFSKGNPSSLSVLCEC